MPVTLSTEQLIELIRKSSLVEGPRLDEYLQGRKKPAANATELAQDLVTEGILTNFQKEQLLQGKWRGYTIGKYKVLERLGTGGMGSVYLCEHQKMKHRVAIKVLPTAKASDPAALGRFYREARASGILDHPNLVRAHDIDQDGELHYLVMDYIDGVNLQQLVSRVGPLSVARACQYISQAALGLQHAAEKDLVHRDIKPANLIVDREGTVLLLDMGLARFCSDTQDLLTLKYDDNNVLGTADYVSPEQARDSHKVDIRTDIYSLGATLYFLLAGRPLFPEGRVAQKLIWHVERQPTPLRQLRPDVPPALEAVVNRMLAKQPDQRYQMPGEVLAALEPWTRTVVPPPDESEIPQLSPAARGPGEVGSGGKGARSPVPRPAVPAAGGRAAVALAAAAPVAAHATPRALTDEHSTDRVISATNPARPGAPARPRRKLHEAIKLMLILAAGAGAGIFLRSQLRGTPAPGDNPPGPEPARVLIVSRTQGEGLYGSIAEALQAARPGDRVQVRESAWDEVLRIESAGRIGQGVTIEGASADGEPVVWHAPAGTRELASLIHLAAVPGLKLRNFALDGRDVTRHLITAAGPCPGLVLEDLRLTGFCSSGVRLTSTVGDSTLPVSLSRLHVIPKREAEAGILLDADPDQPTRWVSVNECRLESALQAGVVINGPSADLAIRSCRLAGLTDGVLCRKGASPAAVQLTLAGNEFEDISQAALHFESPPAVENSRIETRDNRFRRVGQLGRTDGFRAEPMRTVASWIRAEQSPAPGKVYLRKRFTLETTPTRAVLSLTAEPGCVFWLNGQRVGEAAFSDTARRVQSFDVARYLHEGDNVLALQVAGAEGGGVLAELNDNASAVFTRTFASDATWRASPFAEVGWQGIAYEDRTWEPVVVVASYGQGDPRRQSLIWDAVVQEHFKYQANALFPVPTGNERDADSREGFPCFEAVVTSGTNR